jgi:outer membrane protein assembly factor BamB
MKVSYSSRRISWSVAAHMALAAGGWLAAASCVLAADPAARTDARERGIVGWRGDGSGRYAGERPPTRWTPEANTAWKTELPGGSPAMPVVVGNRVFVTSDPALLLCIDSADGKVLWRRGHATPSEAGVVDAAAGGDVASYNPDGDSGSAASTPVCDGSTVYVMFANGVVAAYDLDGKRRWSRFVERPKTHFGHATSPLLADGNLIVQFVDCVALDAARGAPQWRVALPASHATPAAARVAGTAAVIHPAGAVLRARDGKILAEGLFKLDQSSPIVAGNEFYIHENGRMRAFQFPAALGEGATFRELWSAETTRSQYQIASPVLHDHRLYSVNMSGIFQATDARTGNVLYRHRLMVSGRTYASVALAGGHLFVCDQSGNAFVLAPGDTFRSIAENRTDIHPATPVFDGERILVRTWRHLLCLKP